MKPKNLEKLTLPDKDSNKTQIKTTAKAVSPKNTLAKGLLGWKSQKDLHKIISKNSQKSVTISNQSISSQIPENNETMDKKSQRLPKDLNTNINLKILNSPKIVSEVNSPKTQNTQFFRAKNVLPDKQDENTKKIIQEKEEKTTVLQNKILELEAKVDTLSQEKQKSNQIFVQIKNQKEVLEKNLERLKNVANQNKKLLREKAEGFNTSGSQIMSLRAQLSQLTSIKKSTTSVGINTEINLQPKKQQATQQMQSTIAKNSQKLSSYLQILHNFLDPLQERLYFYEQTIYEQQKQLNEFYESKQTRYSCKPNLSTDVSLLQQMKNSQELRQKVQKKQKQIYQLREELWAKDRDFENFRLQIRVKQIFNGHANQEVYEKEEKNNEGEILKLREQIDECKCNLNEKDSRIKELQSKVSQQQLIIRSLQEKKPKQIIK